MSIQEMLLELTRFMRAVAAHVMLPADVVGRLEALEQRIAVRRAARAQPDPGAL